MKRIMLAVTCLTFCAVSFAQTRISIDSVHNHIGETIVVCNEVYGVKTTEKLTYINLGAAYPNSPLTVIIFAKDLANFPEAPEKLYGNQQVCVTGTLKEYKGRAEIVITKPGDIKVE